MASRKALFFSSRDFTWEVRAPRVPRAEIDLDRRPRVLTEKPCGQSADLVFLPMPHGGFKISKSLEGGIYPRSQRWDTSQIVGDRQTDLAAILFQTPPQFAFFAIKDELMPLPAPGRPVAICGYPKAKSKTAEIGSVATDLAFADFQRAWVIDSSSVAGMQPFNSIPHRLAGRPCGCD